MKLSLSLVACALCAGFAFGAEQLSVAPRDEARIAEIAKRLPEKPGMVGFRPADRARWAELAATPFGKSTIKLGEDLLKVPVPPMTDEIYLKCLVHGDANVQPQAFWNRYNGLVRLSFAEALERKGRFLPKIEEYLNAFADEKSWLFAIHDKGALAFKSEEKPWIDLGVGHHAEAIAAAMALHRAEISGPTWSRIYAKMREWAFDPYLALAADGTKLGHQFWFVSHFNWNASCNSGVVRAALNVVDSPLERAAFVEAAERSTREYLKGFSADGYTTEGTSYWAYGFGRYLTLGLALREATGGFVDLFADPITRKTVVEYAYGANVCPGGGLPFADGCSPIGDGCFALARLVWPDLVSTAAMRSDPLKVNFNDFPLRAFGQEPPKATPTMDVLPMRTTYAIPQVFILRESPGASKPGRELSFVVKGGHNGEAHNHNDVGSWQLAVGRTAIAGDPLGLTYSRQVWSAERYAFMMLNSYGHPVPYPAGIMQPVGEAFAAKVISADFSDGKDVVALDLAGAYGATNVVKSLVRTAAFDRNARTLTIVDKVEFFSPQTFESPIVTYSDVVFDYEKQYLTLKAANDVSADVTVSVKGGDWNWRTELIPSQTKVSPKRLAVALAKPVAEAEITFAFKVK